MAPTQKPKSDDAESSNFYDEAGSEFIEFLVGIKRKKFVIHKKLLLSKSGYWNEEYNGRYNPHEEHSRQYHSGDNPDAFAVIFEWIYRQKLKPFPDSTSGQLLLAPPQDSERFKCYSKAITELIEVYYLASKMRIPEIMDLVINQLGKAYYEKRMWPSPQDIKTAYYGVNDGSGLRKFLARSYHFMLLAFKDGDSQGGPLDCKDLLDLANQLPELQKDLFNILRGTSPELFEKQLDHPGWDDVCNYHCHGKADECAFKSKSFRDVAT